MNCAICIPEIDGAGRVIWGATWRSNVVNELWISWSTLWLHVLSIEGCSWFKASCLLLSFDVPSLGETERVQALQSHRRGSTYRKQYFYLTRQILCLSIKRPPLQLLENLGLIDGGISKLHKQNETVPHKIR